MGLLLEGIVVIAVILHLEIVVIAVILHLVIVAQGITKVGNGLMVAILVAYLPFNNRKPEVIVGNLVVDSGSLLVSILCHSFLILCSF